MRKFPVCSAMILGILALALSSNAYAAKPERTTGRGTGPTVFVTSQGLYYDSIVVVDPLPQKGRFQQLKPGAGPGGTLATEFGPGDPGYLGGRWWIDANENGEMDEGDAFFSCPLLGVGSATPPA